MRRVLKPGDFGATNYYKEIDGRTIRVTLGPSLRNASDTVIVTVAIAS